MNPAAYATIARRHSNPSHVVEVLKLGTDPSRTEELLDLFYQNAAKAIAVSIVSRIPEHDRGTLATALHEKDQKKFYDAVRPHIPDLQAFLFDAVESELKETRRRMRC